ncbi:MAG: alpha/beta hydrolase [Chryseobacterium sp.]|nr:alpha/beta hydrolase [Chryseobacterium sp.]
MKKFNLLFAKILFAVLFFCASFLGAQQNYVVSTKVPDHSSHFTDVAYKTVDGKEILLDVFLPKNLSQTPYPVVVQIHGGGWVEGNKDIPAGSYTEKTVLKLLDNGFAVVSIDYRLASKEVHFPALIQDTKDAIRWVRKNTAVYHFDPENIGLWGGSAGGHLALLAAYSGDHDFVGDAGLSKYSAKSNYVLDNFGPTEMNEVFQVNAGKFKLWIMKIFAPKLVDIRSKLIFAVTGKTISDETKPEINALMDAISPLKFVDHAVPTQIMHGTKDNVVPISESKNLLAELQKRHVMSTLEIVKKGNHGFNNISEEEQHLLAQKMVEFARSQLVVYQNGNIAK